MRRALVGSLLSAVVALALACSDKDPRPPPSSSATPPLYGGGSSTSSGASGTSGTSGTNEGGVCNALTLPAGLIDQISVAGDPAPFVGGTVQDGLYELTDARVYIGTGSGPTGVAIKEALSISGGVIQDAFQVQRSSGDAGAPVTEPEAHQTLNYTASGTSLVFSTSCPNPTGDRSYPFTATNTQLVFYDPQSRTQNTYTRR